MPDFEVCPVGTLARLAEAERDSDALRQVRRWLKNGATISATGDGPVLEMVDGVFIGGCTIKFDKARPADSAPERKACDCLYPSPAKYVHDFCALCHGRIADSAPANSHR